MKNARRKFLGFLLATPFAGLLPKQASARSRKVLINAFSVAGFQYYRGPSLIGFLRPGHRLLLAVEPNNRYDEFAVAIYHHGEKIGYIPRSDNRHISRLLLEKISLECIVSEVDPHADTWEMLKVSIFLVS